MSACVRERERVRAIEREFCELHLCVLSTCELVFLCVRVLVAVCSLC